MSRKRSKLSLLIFPILVIIIIGVNSEFVEEPQKPRFSEGEAYPGQGPENAGSDQDEFGSEHEHELERQWYPSGRIMIPHLTLNQPQWGNHPAEQPYPSRGVVGEPSGNVRKKKDCGFPVLTRRLIGPVLKRAQRDLPYFANSQDEIHAKNEEEDTSRVKRAEPSITESHSGGCISSRQWIDMGADYYPRYVKTFHCASSTCDSGFGEIGECKPKHYTTKVLKRITPADTTSVEDCDLTLPESLRFDWKLISVTVTTCCDCVSSPGRLFGLK